jgi:DNA-directed RNA polymerase specialized sigma24 family protein
MRTRTRLTPPPEPSPELAALVVDPSRRLRDSLRSEALCQVLALRLEGYTREEIAQRLGCPERTVRRKLEVIREAWLQGES